MSFDWVSFCLALTTAPSSFWMFRLALIKKSLSHLHFGIAITCILVRSIAALANTEYISTITEWADILAIISVLNALFVKVRNSKPVFARFPGYLTALPILILFFYPLISKADIVKDLLSITLEGGAIAVGTLVVSLNHYLYKERGLLLSSIPLFIASYVAYWFVEHELIHQSAPYLLCVGIVLSVIGFNRVTNSK